MNPYHPTQRIAIIGGGPAALFLYKNLIKATDKNTSIDIFEATSTLGSGMPYSKHGAGYEHITNVSGNEIPQLVTPIVEWMKTLSQEKLKSYNIDPAKFTEYKVFPRLLFGEYLHAQFEMLLDKAEAAGITTNIHLNCRVSDIIDSPDQHTVMVNAGTGTFRFDKIIICTGHNWPIKQEGTTPGYYDSPYPPAKLEKQFNHAIAMKGSSLTAIDAIRTLARRHGEFIALGPHSISFIANEDAPDFKIVMYSLKGLLPGIRFYLEDPRLDPPSLLSKTALEEHMRSNDGFLSLDFIFEKDFKDFLRDKEPDFYQHFKDMKMEGFVEEMMKIREQADPFQLFKAEYEEARLSIKRKESVYWKEMLAVLSFAMNYPAKHFSAEDKLRHQKVLMPLISIIIAFVPQDSAEELIALYEAGRLEIIPVEKDSRVEVHPQKGIVYHHTSADGEKQEIAYKTFIDCTGQPHLMLDDFPFKSLVQNGTLSAARLPFRSNEQAQQLQAAGNKEIERGDDSNFYLKVPGITISDTFRVVDKNGKSNSRICMMAVPYIGGYNPDYSGLDFCEEASSIVTTDIFEKGK